MISLYKTNENSRLKNQLLNQGLGIFLVLLVYPAQQILGTIENREKEEKNR